ncbi:MAG TPA: DNA polymerase III subunit delta' [Burkholderiaceae bacterium]
MEAALYPWQEADWDRLQQLAARLPHAILFHGAPGIGKAHFAEQFAQSMLCESRDARGHACNACASCTWFVQHNHPDYRRVRPEALEEDGGDSEEGESKAESKTKAAKTPSKDIKIDQIRALADFMNVSTHRSGKRVVLMYPAENLNGAAANALLKTLEEPPPDTVFLLVSGSLDRLLPTILSRCRKIALTQPDHASALAWLSEQGVAEADSVLAEHGGAPLAALEHAAGREEMLPFLQYLAAPGAELALKTAEKYQKSPLPQLVGIAQRWLYDLFSYKMTGVLRYYPRYQKQFAALAARTETPALLAALKTAADKRAVADHPLSGRLFVEDMLLDYAALFARR